MFNERKVAQIAAYFLDQTEGKRMSHLKLMKLLYLADREAVRQFGFSISEDKFVAMPHGPVLSMTLDLMNGHVESQPNGWEFWISDKENHEVSLNNPLISLENLDELSEVELDILQQVWKQFGSMDQWKIRDWTHDNCAEWRDPNGSSCPIDFQEMAQAVGFNSEDAKELQANKEAWYKIEQLFASL